MVAVKRRQQQTVPEPPARLLAFDPADWLPLLDARAYDPDMYRQRRDGVPYGDPSVSFRNWQHQEARSLWGRARRAWHEEHGGWPGGLTPLDLLRQERAERRAAVGERW